MKLLRSGAMGATNMTKSEGWKQSQYHAIYRRPQRLGALAKWRREHPEEAAMVDARYERERVAA